MQLQVTGYGFVSSRVSSWERVVALRAGIFLLSIVYCLSSSSQNPDFRNWKNDKACVAWVDSVFNQLSLEERIGQFFMLPAYTEGKLYNMDSVLSWMKQGKAGGVIFFKGLPEAEAEWTNKIQDSTIVKAFVAIDGEWGLAMRLDSTISFPHQIALGAVADNKLIYEMGREIGRECKRIGININFAPDVDVNNNPNNPVINDRSFGEDKYKVALKGIEYADGMQDEGVLACAKHFPGHGDVNTDSHYDLPLITKSAAAFDSLEFYPFKILFKNNVGSAMVAHLNVPSLDSTGMAASLSYRIATNYLQDSLAFNGLVFSDALNMKGVAKYYKPGTVDSMAFMAGCDILVFSEDASKGIEKIKASVDSACISLYELELRVKKVLAYKYKLGLNRPQHVNLENLRDDLNNAKGKLLRQKLYEAAITIAANQNNLLPLRDWNYKRVASLSIGNNGSSQFQQHINNFVELDFFNQPLEHNEKFFTPLLDTLASYDLVIVDLHAMIRSAAKNYNVTEETRKFVEALSGRTKVVLCVFGNPYSLKYFEYIPWILEAYEDNDATNLAAANALFGAEKISGKLPVTASPTFVAGNGFIADSVYRLKISSPEEVGMQTSALKKVDEVIQRGMDGKAFPGCQLLMAKNGKVIWNKCYGTKIYELADDRVKPTDLYDLASITKVAATTIAVMKLCEQKKINLDKTVSDYLDLPRDATIKNLKLRDVLTHQAGLKAFFMFYKNTVDSNFEKYYRNTFDSSFSIRVADSIFIRSDYPDTMWSIISHSPIEEHPKYVYSDNDFYILQKIVERVSGKTLDEFVSENFYQPMGLTRIGFKPRNKFSATRIAPTENDSAFRKQIICGYVHDPGSAMYGGVAGHAGVFSNAFDLAALFQMLLNNGTYNGKRLLDSCTIHNFTSRQSKISRRGFGFDKPEPDVTKPSPCYDGVPLSVFGHTGFTGTCVWSDPENNLTYIFLSNRVYPNAENNQLVKMNIRTDLQEVIYKALNK
ncbi:MAG: serine hydrolase [Bacteroidetes bacterium]|nr:serine hydrolase [Bacteroidota bacterium]